jgi:hypothetical protein
MNQRGPGYSQVDCLVTGSGWAGGYSSLLGQLKLHSINEIPFKVVDDNFEVNERAFGRL